VADPIQEILKALRDDPKLMHAVLFDPDTATKHVSSREAKALVYGVDPARFVTFVLGERFSPIAGPGCVDTCGAKSCGDTCGSKSCDATCASSCGKTCSASCEQTTKHPI